MKYIDADKLKAEIERRIKECEATYPKDKGGYWFPEQEEAYAIAEEYKQLLSFLGTLEDGASEKPNNQMEIVNDLTSEVPTRAVQLPDGRWVTEKLAHQIESEKQMQEELEEELEKFIESGESVTVDNYGTYQVSYHDFKKIARHFAEWGKEQGYREGFLEGAKIQREEDNQLVDIIYQQGIEKGKDEMREKAIEGNIFFHPHFQTPVISVEGINPEAFSNDTKVKLVILKNDE